MSSKTGERTPVLIVGGGPVGLGLALDLGWRGVPCTLIEQTNGTIDFPRANAVNVRTMEFCRRWGIADAVIEAATPTDYPHTALYITALTGFEIGRVERPGHGGDRPSAFSPGSPQRCNQLWFDPILAEAAKGFAETTLRYRTRFDSFTQDSDGVSATVTNLDAGTQETIEAEYMIACCGGRSGIRQTLGIELEGMPSYGYPVSFTFRTEELWSYHDKGKGALHYMIGTEGIWGTMVSLNGRELWFLSVTFDNHDAVPGPEEADRWLKRAFGTDIPYELVSITPWVRREMVAQRYGEGRVMLAGDCAHLNGPEGGYGMNTGIGDAVDLGWKLWAVHDGWAGPGLLASYEAERRPVAQRNVAEATRNKRVHKFDADAIMDASPEGERQRRKIGQGFVADGTRRHGHDGLALGYRYADSPICCTDSADDKAGLPADDIANFIPTTYPGARAPHARLAEGRSTLDLFGSGFTLLRLGADAPDCRAFSAAAADKGVPMTVEQITAPEACDLYEMKLVLVRPDGHVALRADALPEDPAAVIERVRGASLPAAPTA